EHKTLSISWSHYHRNLVSKMPQLNLLYHLFSYTIFTKGYVYLNYKNSNAKDKRVTIVEKLCC
ncbi:hypothetical protein ACJJZO_005195, partial [Escherichia coli]